MTIGEVIHPDFENINKIILNTKKNLFIIKINEFSNENFRFFQKVMSSRRKAKGKFFKKIFKVNKLLQPRNGPKCYSISINYFKEKKIKIWLLNKINIILTLLSSSSPVKDKEDWGRLDKIIDVVIINSKNEIIFFSVHFILKKEEEI